MTPFSHPAHRTGQADLPHPALGQDFTPLLSRATPSAVSEHSAEFIGCPISRSFTTYFVCLELRSLPSTGITRLQRYYEPLRHPKAPGLSLTGLRLVVADRALGLPVFRALSLCTCCRHYPGAASGRITSLISSRRSSLPRKGCRVGLRIVLFEMLWGRRWARWHHRRLKQLADGASHVRTQRLEQVPYFSGARQDDHCGHRDELIQLVRCRHYSRHRASSTEEA